METQVLLTLYQGQRTIPWPCRTQHLPLPQDAYRMPQDAYRMPTGCLQAYTSMLVDLDLAVLILRGHQRTLYSLVILGLLSAKNLG